MALALFSALFVGAACLVASGSAHVHVIDERYADETTAAPLTIIVEGAWVRWMFDEGYHSVTAPGFDSGVRWPGREPFDVSFPDAGAYGYACVVHEWMRGVVLVRAPS